MARLRWEPLDAFAQLTYRPARSEACVRSAPSSTTWDSTPRWRAPHSTPTTRDWRIYDFAQVLKSRGPCTPARSAWISIKVSTRTRPPSTCASRCSPEPSSDKARRCVGPARQHPHVRITDGKTHDVNILDEFLPEPGAFYVMDRAYVDFERLFVFTLCSSFFVVRTKKNIAPTALLASRRQDALGSDRHTDWNRPKPIPTRCGGSATSTPRRTSG